MSDNRDKQFKYRQEIQQVHSPFRFVSLFLSPGFNAQVRRGTWRSGQVQHHVEYIISLHRREVFSRDPCLPSRQGNTTTAMEMAMPTTPAVTTTMTSHLHIPSRRPNSQARMTSHMGDPLPGTLTVKPALHELADEAGQGMVAPSPSTPKPTLWTAQHFVGTV